MNADRTIFALKCFIAFLLAEGALAWMIVISLAKLGIGFYWVMSAFGIAALGTNTVMAGGFLVRYCRNGRLVIFDSIAILVSTMMAWVSFGWWYYMSYHYL